MALLAVIAANSGPVSINATGGTITTSGGIRSHTFTSAGTWTLVSPATATISYFIAGGGGGGGCFIADGGGGGGYVTGSTTVSAAGYSVTVGSGGPGSSSSVSNSGGNGGTTTVSGLTASYGAGGGNIF